MANFFLLILIFFIILVLEKKKLLLLYLFVLSVRWFQKKFLNMSEPTHL